MNKMKNIIKTFPANTQGRDYAIGDLHGTYAPLANFMKQVNFDPAVDRIFSVGDLVDRGPSSKKCLSLIEEPWFHSVLANHEQLMIAAFDGTYMGRWWYPNGGTWGMEAVNDYVKRHERPPTDESLAIFDLVEKARELPFLITVNLLNGKKVHLIHAELPYSDEPITDEFLADPEKVYELATTQVGDGDAFLWCRYMFMNAYKKDVAARRPEFLEMYRKNSHAFSHFNENLSHIISGHTIMRHPLTLVGQTNIDTGAYHSVYIPAEPYQVTYTSPEPWAGLTVVDLNNWIFFKVTDNTITTVEPTVFTHDDIFKDNEEE